MVKGDTNHRVSKVKLAKFAEKKYLQAGGEIGSVPPSMEKMARQITKRKLTMAQAWAWVEIAYREDVRRLYATVARHNIRRTKKRQSSESFYKSEQWKAVRFQALKRSNGCCVLCGRSNREHGVVLHVDHIKPRSKYPALALDLFNLQVLCDACNIGRSNTDETDWSVGLDSMDWRQW